MTPTAVSQIVEQIFRVITMILLADLFLPWGLDYAAAGASLGALAGAVTGLVVLVYFHWKLDRDIERDYGAASSCCRCRSRRRASCCRSCRTSTS